MDYGKTPANFMLLAHEIRHIRHAQLSLLTGINASNFPRWDQGRQFSERTLERLAEGLHTSKAEVLKGFDLRRQDTAIARAAQIKADQLIAYLGLANQETA